MVEDNEWRKGKGEPGETQDTLAELALHAQRLQRPTETEPEDTSFEGFERAFKQMKMSGLQIHLVEAEEGNTKGYRLYLESSTVQVVQPTPGEQRTPKQMDFDQYGFQIELREASVLSRGTQWMQKLMYSQRTIYTEQDAVWKAIQLINRLDPEMSVAQPETPEIGQELGVRVSKPQSFKRNFRYNASFSTVETTNGRGRMILQPHDQGRAEQLRNEDLTNRIKDTRRLLFGR